MSSVARLAGIADAEADADAEAEAEAELLLLLLLLLLDAIATTYPSACFLFQVALASETAC
jgi:hypothetical protein